MSLEPKPGHEVKDDGFRVLEIGDAEIRSLEVLGKEMFEIDHDSEAKALVDELVAALREDPRGERTDHALTAYLDYSIGIPRDEVARMGEREVARISGPVTVVAQVGSFDRPNRDNLSEEEYDRWVRDLTGLPDDPGSAATDPASGRVENARPIP